MRISFVILFFAASWLHTQDRNFAGVVGGVSTLKADGAFSLESGVSAQSQYKPENGLTVMVFAGKHLHDYFSVQASYSWNRNSALVSASEFGLTESAYLQDRTNTQHAVIGEGMIYFRNLQSRVRPFLTAGAGFHHFRSIAKVTRQ